MMKTLFGKAGIAVFIALIMILPVSAVAASQEMLPSVGYVEDAELVDYQESDVLTEDQFRIRYEDIDEPGPIPPPEPPKPSPSWPPWWYPGTNNKYIKKTVKDPQTGKWVENIEAHVNDTIQFRIIVKAAGSLNMRYVHVYDYLPLGFEFISSDPLPKSTTGTLVTYYDVSNHCYYQFHQYEWYFSGIKRGQTKTITITAKVTGIPSPPPIQIQTNYSIDDILHIYPRNYSLPKPIRPIPPFNITFINYTFQFTGRNMAVLEGKEVSSGCGNVQYPIKKSDGADIKIVPSNPSIDLIKTVYDVPTHSWVKATTVNISDCIDFSLLIVNDGNVILNGPIILIDALPSNLEYYDHAFVSYGYGSTWTYPIPLEPDAISVDGKTLKWTFMNSLDPGYAIRLIFRARAIQSGLGVNSANVTVDDLEDTDTAIVTVNAPDEPDIQLDKTVTLDPCQGWYDSVTGHIGDKLYFKLVVTNSGNVVLHHIHVWDKLPGFLAYVPGSSNHPPSSQSGQYIEWDFDTLGVGSSITIIFAATATIAGDCCNVANVTTDEGVEDDDFACVTILEYNPDISLIKEVYNESSGSWEKSVKVVEGDDVIFQIRVGNTGNVPLHNVYVQDDLPAFLTYNTGSSSDPLAVEQPHHLEWDLGNLAVSQIKTITFTAHATEPGEGDNFANVTTDEDVGAEDSAHVVAEEEATPCIDVEKKVKWDCTPPFEDVIEAHVGDWVTFRINVTNTGNVPLDITVTDKLPDGLTYDDNAIPWEPNETVTPPMGGVVHYIWYFNDVQPGETITIMFRANVDECGTFVNIVNATGVYDCYDVYGEDSATVEVLCPDIAVTKTPDITEGRVGDVVNYTIVVTNTGDDTLYDVYVNDTTLGISYYIDSLAADESKTYYVEHTLAEEPDPFENCVTAEGYDELGEKYSDSDCATVDVIPEELNITVEKYVKWDCTPPFEKELYITPEEWEQAQWVTFKIYVNNTGETPLDIVVKDRLPDGLTYADSATPFEYNYTDGTYYYWNFTNVQPQTSIEITFVADVEDCGDYNNTVEVIGSYEDYEVHDEDYAVVHVPCECEPGVSVDKKIWDEETGSWVDDLLVDEYPVDVRFNITIENIGTCDLINITVEDTLECGLGGARNFSIEPDDVGAGYIVWYFDGPLASSEKIFIEFEATALTNTANNVTVKANSSDDETQVSDSDTVTISLSQGAPVLSFSPSSYDFGSMMAGGTGSTTFEIWNNGGGQLNYTLSETCDWVSVSPLSGNSSGEHDVITVSIDTTDLSEGLHVCDISISSDGGSGTFTVIVNVTGEQPPVLSFSPSSYDFGSMMAGGTGSTTFEIWNNGGGQLNYTLSETCDWVSVSPLSGNSSGEHDVITVSIDTTDLSEGTLYTCDVSISSNGGSGTFTVQVYIMEEQQPIPPTVEIVKPEKNKLYFRDKPVIRILRTIIIGPVTIEANATDDGYIWKVEFFIDDTLKYTDYSAPYSWLWNETVFGKHTIKVKAYDDDGLTAEDELNVTIFNFGFGSVEEKGTVKGKVTEAGKMIKKGIPGVLVTASDGSNTTTGKIPFISRGKYSLQLSPGVYDITFEADGYVTYVEEDVEVTAGDTITLDIELEPACEGCE